MKQIMLLKVKRGGVKCSPPPQKGSLNKEVTTSYRKKGGRR